MQGSFKLVTLASIDIRLHYTWLLAFFLIAWSLAFGYFPMSDQERSQVTYWILGFVGALLLFASVLLHEIGHSLVARARGLHVDSITLFIFGGVSNITSEATTALDEFRIAAVGPVTSLVLAALFWGISTAAAPSSAASAVAGYLASANLVLGLFNLVPGFPLDGGRVLRSIVWAVTRSMERATRVASYVGQAVAFGLIAWGVLQALNGNVFGGIWTGFIGCFLNSAAETSRMQTAVRSELAAIPVASVMDSSPAAVSPRLSVGSFAMDYVLQGRRRAVPVLDGGQLVGIISVTDAKHLDQQAWARTHVGEVMTRVPLKSLSPDADVATALELMVASGVHQVPIVQNGALMGMLSRADVMRSIQSGPARRRRSSAPTAVITSEPKAAPSQI